MITLSVAIVVLAVAAFLIWYRMRGGPLAGIIIQVWSITIGVAVMFIAAAGVVAYLLWTMVISNIDWSALP